MHRAKYVATQGSNILPKESISMINRFSISQPPGTPAQLTVKSQESPYSTCLQVPPSRFAVS